MGSKDKYARLRRGLSKGMNKTETRWAGELKKKLLAGDIQHYDYECLTFKVGDGKTTYKPDFFAVTASHIVIYEVKGAFITDSAKIKFKAAALKYPWMEWIMVQWKNGQWTEVYRF